MNSLVIVKWVDTSTHPGWQDNVEGLCTTEAFTVGFLAGRDDATIKLAQTITTTHCHADVTVIPLGCIEYLFDFSTDTDFIGLLLQIAETYLKQKKNVVKNWFKVKFEGFTK